MQAGEAISPVRMRTRTRILITSLALLTALLCAAGPAGAIPCAADRCKSFDAPGADGAIASGPDGALWFVAQGFVGRVTPNGDVRRFPAPTTAQSDIEAGP